ncbi:hypothetical protein CUJ89_23740 [Burkholderia pyrrocinia]|uniref:Uncharacterized protein n=1 Tax=Burkholderia pyrrocinia TaxID=60550 RepID=A0A2Z5N430_BURPY|nr:hypothetical protein CUJ89_23740 [Burkholderia pyrrocinia]
MRSLGNAFRLRSVTKNCLPRRIRIIYIAIHFSAFLACPNRLPRRAASTTHPSQAIKMNRSLDRSAGGIQRTRIAMAEAAS